ESLDRAQPRVLILPLERARGCAAKIQSLRYAHWPRLPVANPKNPLFPLTSPTPASRSGSRIKINVRSSKFSRGLHRCARFPWSPHFFYPASFARLRPEPTVSSSSAAILSSVLQSLSAVRPAPPSAVRPHRSRTPSISVVGRLAAPSKCSALSVSLPISVAQAAPFKVSTSTCKLTWSVLKCVSPALFHRSPIFLLARLTKPSHLARPKTPSRLPLV